MVYDGGTITMLQDALIKCLEGKTSFEEVYRTIEIENEDDDNYENEMATEIKDSIPAAVVETESDDLLEEGPKKNTENDISNVISAPAFTAADFMSEEEKKEAGLIPAEDENAENKDGENKEQNQDAKPTQAVQAVQPVKPIEQPQTNPSAQPGQAQTAQVVQAIQPIQSVAQIQATQAQPTTQAQSTVQVQPVVQTAAQNTTATQSVQQIQPIQPVQPVQPVAKPE